MRSQQWPVLLVPFSLVLLAGGIAFQTLPLTPGQTLFCLFGSSGMTEGWNKRMEQEGLEPTQTPGVGWKKETGKISPINWWKLISAGNKQQAFLFPRQESGMQLDRKIRDHQGGLKKDLLLHLYSIMWHKKNQKTNIFYKCDINNLVKLFKNWKEQHVSVLVPVSRGHSWSFGLISAELQSPAALSGVNLQTHAGVSAGININQHKKSPTHAQILFYRLKIAVIATVLLPSTALKQLIQSAEGKWVFLFFFKSRLMSLNAPALCGQRLP